jgi:hypothetical protein
VHAAFTRIVIAASVCALVCTQLFFPTPVQAAGCVRFVDSQFDPPGADEDHLNSEWVRIKNVCATRRNIGGWVIHDYHRIHVYRFPATFRVGAGVAVTLHTGYGDNTHRNRYWGYSAPVWNNAPPEWAYLKNSDGTLKSKWTEY